jgi:hypothetical protein
MQDLESSSVCDYIKTSLLLLPHIMATTRDSLTQRNEMAHMVQVIKDTHGYKC